MKGFQSSQGLVDEVLSVVVGKILSTDDTMHVCFHEFLDYCFEELCSGD